MAACVAVAKKGALRHMLLRMRLLQEQLKPWHPMVSLHCTSSSGHKDIIG